MYNSIVSTTLAGNRWDARPPFSLVVAYEDQPTRDRALHLSHHLSRQLVDEYDFQCSWWKFDHLANATLREQASCAASEANMIVLAMNARVGMSPLQTEWIHSWLGRRQSIKAALVALVATPDATPDPRVEATTGYLRGLARSAHLDFFAHSFELPKSLTPSGSDVAEKSEAHDSDTATPIATETQDQFHFKMPIPRWGINE